MMTQHLPLLLLALTLALGWGVHAYQLYQRLGRGRLDPLTGLLTRDGWSQHAQRVLRRHRTAAVILCDLDDFKPVNDVHGHAAGDAVLAATGQRLAAWCAGVGAAGRLGGDEFVAVLKDDERLDDRLADLAELIRHPVVHDGQVLRVGASVGAAYRSQLQTPDLSTALATADAAMYRAKGRGRRSRRLLGAVGRILPALRLAS